METERLKLRRFESTDAESCFESFGQSEDLGKYVLGFPVENLAAMEKMVEGFRQNPDIWLIEDKAAALPLGYVSVEIAYEILGIGEIGYVIGGKYQRKGYAKEAVSRILDYYFQERDLYMIEAKVNENNIPSQRLLEKLGFCREAVLRNRRIDFVSGERSNLIVYSMLKCEKCSRADA